MSIAITAPTGNIGSSLVTKLLDANADLTLIVRNPEKLDAAVRDRVKVAQGDMSDHDFMQKATEGAEALFLLAPPNPTAPDMRAYYWTLVNNAADAIRANNIAHVVVISSGGEGYKGVDSGIIGLFFELEKALNAAGASTMHLRCGNFMENFLFQLEPLRTTGAFYNLYRPEVPLPFVATRDIATVAAEKLLDRSWTGINSLAVQGAADVSSAEAAQILTEAVGKPIHYIQVPAEQVLQSYLGMGASQDAAEMFVKMFQAFDDGAYRMEPRTPETTNPTTLKQWANEVLKPLLNP